MNTQVIVLTACIICTLQGFLLIHWYMHVAKNTFIFVSRISPSAKVNKSSLLSRLRLVCCFFKSHLRQLKFYFGSEVYMKVF